jgi:hypothetical protein
MEWEINSDEFWCCSYENLSLPRHTPKRIARGPLMVGRKKTSVTGTRRFERKNYSTVKHSNVRQSASEARCEIDNPAKSNHESETDASRSQPPSSILAVQKSKKTPKRVRFDEDSEWIDISDDNVLDCFMEEEDEGIYMIDEDEYILL